MRSGTRPLVLVALVAAIVMLAASLLQPVTWLQATTSDGTRLVCARVSGTTPITLTFTHSMYGGFVMEHYRLGADGMLERQRIVTENAAAAEYYATDGRVRQAPDGYEVVAGPFATDELIIRVDGIGNHRLSVGARRWHVFDIVGEPAQVRISGNRAPVIRVPDDCEASGQLLAIKGFIA